MATPRKNYSRFFDEMAWTGWSNIVLATLIRVQALMNARWARHGLTPAEANEITLTPQDMMVVTNTRSPSRALKILLALPTDTPMGSLEVRQTGSGRDLSVTIFWSKFSESQGYGDRRHPNSGRNQGGEERVKGPQEKKREKKEQGGGRPNLTPPPDDLSWEQRKKLLDWVGKIYPSLSDRTNVRRLVDACLSHYRAKGKEFADWEATCELWISREFRFQGERASSRHCDRGTGVDDFTSLSELLRPSESDQP